LTDSTEIDAHCRLSKSIFDVELILVNGAGRDVVHVVPLLARISVPVHERPDVLLVELE
jgi:hypothetical protein